MPFLAGLSLCAGVAPLTPSYLLILSLVLKPFFKYRGTVSIISSVFRLFSLKNFYGPSSGPKFLSAPSPRPKGLHSLKLSNGFLGYFLSNF